MAGNFTDDRVRGSVSRAASRKLFQTEWEHGPPTWNSFVGSGIGLPTHSLIPWIRSLKTHWMCFLFVFSRALRLRRQAVSCYTRHMPQAAQPTRMQLGSSALALQSKKCLFVYGQVSG